MFTENNQLFIAIVVLNIFAEIISCNSAETRRLGQSSSSDSEKKDIYFYTFFLTLPRSKGDKMLFYIRISREICK